jgi:hypothetical protein
MIEYKNAPQVTNFRMIEYKIVCFVMISKNTKNRVFVHVTNVFLHDLSTHKHTKIECVI